MYLQQVVHLINRHLIQLFQYGVSHSWNLTANKYKSSVNEVYLPPIFISPEKSYPILLLKILYPYP